MTENLLSVVVLFWNNSEKTIKCINSIYNQKNIKLSLILVDNNSDNKFSQKVLNWLRKKKIKIEYIKKKIINTNNSKKKCFYIKNNINLGCGLGHNPGYAISIKNKFKYIARIDNDMFLPPRLLSALVRRLNKNKNIIAISPKVMFEAEPKLIWYRGTHIGNNLKFQKQCSNYKPGHRDNKKYKGLINTDSVVGCASIVRANILKKSGLSDPDFFYGEEDIELSHRLKKNNGELKIDLDQKIYHSVSTTVGQNWAKNIYYNYKYRLLLIKKIGTFWDKFFGYLIPIIKLFISFIFILNIKNSSKIIQRYFALKHFFQEKFGEFDRKNYSSIDNFFAKISKNTTCFDVILILKNKKFT